MGKLKILKQLHLEKRLVLIFVVFLLFVMLGVKSQQTSADEGAFVSPIAGKTKLEAQIPKLKGDAAWKPRGWGSGEYLSSIPIINSGAVVDLDTGEVYWSLNLEKKIAPASLTKVATIMTALDIADANHSLYVSHEASEQIPTKLGLNSGERLTLSEAASAAIMTSANDATETISDSIGSEIGGGTATFMELVNAKVKKIGATHSNFVTSTGLDGKDHFSTVYDLLIIGRDAWKNYPLIKEASALPYKKIEANENHRMFDLPNWNALLGTYPGVNGLKIGYTEEAGHSTMVTAQRDGKNLIAVVIGAKSLEDREIAAATLLNYGFEKQGIGAYPIAKLDLKNRFEDWHRQLTQGGP